jgi:hypothetical protein
MKSVEAEVKLPGCVAVLLADKNFRSIFELHVGRLAGEYERLHAK